MNRNRWISILLTGIFAFVLLALGVDALNMPAAWAAPVLGFAPAVNYASGSSTESVTFGDFNRDGDLDMAVANMGSDYVSVQMGNGDGTFAAAVNYAVTNPMFVACADLDTDGDLDLVSTNLNGPRVNVFLGNGDGTFAAAVGYAASSYSEALAIGDLDGDGDPDLVVVNYTTDNVGVLMGNGNGTFAAQVTYAVGDAPYDVAAGDLDGDGDLDLVTANFLSGNASVLLNNGNGTFAAQVTYSMPDYPQSVVVGDLDRDGDLDMVTVSYAGSDDLKVRLGNGDGTFAAAVSYEPGINPVDVSTSDLDRDGDLDLVVVNSNGTNVSVLRGNGNGTFAAPSYYSVGGYPQQATAGDLDGDGDLDLAVANSTSNNVSVLINTTTVDRTGGFLPAVNYAAGGGATSVAAGDLDSDGDLDLATANVSGASVSVLMGSGNGAFAAPANYGVGNTPYAVKAGDLDRDGDLDLVTGNYTHVGVLLNNGNGTFAGVVTYGGLMPHDVALGDLDGDGDLDLAVANYNGNTMGVRLGNGSGAFGGETTYAVGSYPDGIAAGDFDRDGDLDMAVTNQIGTMSVLLNNGNGTFAGAVNYGMGSNPQAVTAGDFDRDGDLDLAVAHDNGVNVRLGDGSGAFGGAVNYGAGASIYGVTTADLNRDGDLDLVAVDRGNNRVIELQGQGDGTFATWFAFPVGSSPYSAAAADLDRDGDLDLAVANNASSNVSVLLNMAPPLLAAPVASGLGDCSTWANACTLQTALAVAASGDQIWVKAGVHYPGASGNRTATFTLKNGVAVYGGFAGTEIQLSQRNWSANPTILSGDIDGNDTKTGGVCLTSAGISGSNSIHVVTGGGTDATALLDGFTITCGQADGSYPSNSGGGMFNDNYSSPTLAHLTVQGNMASVDAGGMFNNLYSSPSLTDVTFIGNSSGTAGAMFNWRYSSPTLTDVTFINNVAVGFGGGMRNTDHSNPTLVNVTFSGNSVTAGNGGGMGSGASCTPTLTDVVFVGNSVSGNGGGMYNDGGSLTLTNVTLTGNSAGNAGGGMFNNSSSSPNLNNVIFYGNSANIGGGMHSDTGSTPILTNVTFYGNSATTSGGGMYNTGSSPALTNAILWGNTAPSGAQIYDNGATPVVSYSDIQGGYAGTGNIDADPLFVGAPGNLRLGFGSPAIDMGTNTGCSATDMDGVTRPQDGNVDGSIVCDMGAYETRPPALFAAPGASGVGDCSSWVNACTLQTALSVAVSGDPIWVKAGVHTPGAAGNRSATFTLKNGVAVYGGFAGTETALAQRDWLANPTILSGDIDGNDTTTGGVCLTSAGISGSNSYHVVSGGGTDVTAVLDGFTITCGQANGGSYPEYFGGGMYNSSSSPTLTNLNFQGNSANIDGGGMFNDWNPVLTNIAFTGNSAGSGGGMYNAGSPTLTNVTFYGNSAGSAGGGIYNDMFSSLSMTNAILWGNTAPSGAQIYDDFMAFGIVVTYSDIQGGYAGTGNLDADPLFVGAPVSLRLGPGSPAIDTGTNAGCPAGDINGGPRPLDGNHDSIAICDMGAYEAYTGPLYYAAPNAVGRGDCSSWAHACALQTALATAASSEQIWVQAGVHLPGAARTDTFTLKNGVGVYGGFAGTETLLTQRDWLANPTILSGDIDSNDATTGGVCLTTGGISGSNSYHVVTGGGTDATAVLDGFTITCGQANGSSPADSGGGMYNDNSSPTLVHLTFQGNLANWDGGGMFNNNSSSPSLTNVVFINNRSAKGGGMLNWQYSSPTLTDVTFTGNAATDSGGGMRNVDHSNPTLSNVTFSSNTAPYGGGVFNEWYASPSLVNVTFSSNTATQSGGGMYNYVSSPSLVNVTFAGNSATNAGGGMNNDNSSFTLTNAILWGNTAPTGAQIYNYNGSSLVVTYSDIQGGYAGTGNIDADPLFVGAPGNLRLSPGSPAIDAGTNTGCPAADIEGTPRPQDGDGDGIETCDMGAYEVPNTAPTISAIADQTTPEDVPTAAIPFTIGDGQTDPILLTLSAQSSDLTLAPLGGLAFGGAGTNRNLVVTPGLNQFGVATITVTVSDAIYTASTSFVLTVTALNDAPTLTSIGNQSGDEQTLISFTASATDVEANNLTFSLDPGAPAGAGITTGGLFTWMPTEAQGPDVYTITVRVTDDGAPALDDFETLQITVNEVNNAPALGLIGSQGGDELTLISFTATASDIDLPSNTLTFSLDAGAPAGAGITTGGLFTWTPTDAQGPGVYSVTVRVTDNGAPAQDDFETLQITVNDTNLAPVLDPIGSQGGDELTSISFTATATDSDVPINTLTFSLDAGYPAGASIDPLSGLFTWTPSEAQGPGVYPVTVRVADDGTPALDDFETFQITVDEVNLAPIAVDDAYATLENTPAVLDVLANDSDPDGNPIWVSGVAAPLHGSATTDGLTIVYTPTTAYLGGDTFVYTLSDGVLTDTAQVTMAVNSPCQVTNQNDSGPGSLRQALIDAAPGETICFASNLSGSIVFASPIVLTKNITIDNTQGIIFSGGSTRGVTGITRIFEINIGVTVALNNVTINNGYTSGQGGGILNRGILTVRNSSFTSNAANQGGAIYNLGTLTILHSTFWGNTAAMGGGILNLGTLNMNSSVLSQNGSSNCYLGNAISSGGYNVSSDATCQFGGLNDRNNVGVQTLPAQPDGTAPLLADSIAIDNVTAAGLCIDPDQMGTPRSTPCDSGALEFNGSLLARLDANLLAAPERPYEGQVVTYTFSVQDVGPGDAANLSISLPLPAGLDYTGLVSWTGGVGCTQGVPPTMLTCTSLPTGGALNLTAFVEVITADVGAQLVVTATATADLVAPASSTFLVITSEAPPPPFPGRYVSTSGLDTGVCNTPETACQTFAYTLGQAVNGDTIYIGEGTYYEYDILINKNVTLLGLGGTANTIIDAGQQSRVFNIVHYVTVTMEELTIQNGVFNGYGGGIYNLGTLTINHCALMGNVANGGLGYGGGIFNNGLLVVTNSAINGNTASGNLGYGGGIFSNGTATVVNTTISGNNANGDLGYGGGVFNDGTMTISSSTIGGNLAKVGGGILNTTVLTVRNSILWVNTASTQADGLFNIGTLSISHSVLQEALGGTNNIVADPWFVRNPGTDGAMDYGNLRLKPGSPAIGRGQTCPLSDVVGVERLTNCSSGAYEYLYAVAGPTAIQGPTDTYIFPTVFGNVTLEIPPGAVAQTVYLGFGYHPEDWGQVGTFRSTGALHSPQDWGQVGTMGFANASFTPYDEFYQPLPEDFTFLRPLTLTLEYDPALVVLGLEDDLMSVRYNPLTEGWERFTDDVVIDKVNHRVTFPILQAGQYSLVSLPSDLYAEISAAAAAGVSNLSSGSVVTYTLVTLNTTSVPIFNLEMTHVVPDGLTFLGFVEDNGATWDGTTITWPIDYLAVGGLQTASFTVQVSSDPQYRGQTITSTVTLSSLGGLTASGETRISVNAPSIPVTDLVTVRPNTVIVLRPTANDYNPDLSRLVITGVSTPAHGAIRLLGDTVIYTPTLNYSGADSFSYTVVDGEFTITGTVNARVETLAFLNVAKTVEYEFSDAGVYLPDVPRDREVVYTIRLVNAPNAEVIQSVVITDVLPAGIQFTAWITQSGATLVDGVIHWSAAEVPAGTVIVIRFRAAITANFGDLIENAVQASASNADSVSAGASFTIVQRYRYYFPTVHGGPGPSMVVPQP